MRISTSSIALLAMLPLALGISAQKAHADSASDIEGKSRTLNTGADIYQHVCQGCHMPGGKGAEGAGARFPALAGNPKLQAGGYPIYVLLNGFGGMPSFNTMLNDEQIANIVNYIRNNFGNHYTDAVKPSDVATQRPARPPIAE